MLALSNSTAQTLAPGASMTFDTVLLSTGSGERFRKNAGLVSLRGNKGIYHVSFGANIGDSTGTASAQLSIQFNGATLPETTAITPTPVAGDISNVSRGTSLYSGTQCNCGSFGDVTVVNTGTTTITVGANPIFEIVRRA